MFSLSIVMLVVACFLLQLSSKEVLSQEFARPPSTPSIFTFDNWRDLMHTDQATFSDLGASPLPPVSESWRDAAAEIFVGVVSYRDRRCSDTLANLFDKAEFPDRVRVGIVEQIHTEEDYFSCIADYCKTKHATIDANCLRQSQISIIQLTHNDARGPNFARYMQDSLHQNEEFCMQVDAHSDFAPHWDTLLTGMWGAVQNEYAVLSSTPADISVLQQAMLNDDDQLVPHLCQTKVDERGMIVSLPPTVAAHLPRPILAPLYSAGNVFSKCHAVEKVPADPNLQMIFDADEFPTYARLWTRGYDVYTPNKIAVAHDYFDKMPSAGKNPPNVAMEWATRRPGQAQFNRYLYDRSMERISTLLGFPGAKRDLAAVTTLTRYGLGTRRSLEQFIEFTGVDTRKKTVSSDRCEELKWVPYTPSPDPYVDSLDVWGGAPETLIAGAGDLALLSGAESVIIYPLEAFFNGYSDALAVSSSIGAGSAAQHRAPLNSIENFNNLNKISMQDLNPLKGVDVKADVKYLRAKVKGYVGEAKVELKKDFQQVGDLVKHRGSELWWLFQPLDSALESVMNRIDGEFGAGMGSKVMKLFLMLLPMLCIIVILAYRTLVTDPTAESDFPLPSIFGTSSPTSRKHTNTGKQH